MPEIFNYTQHMVDVRIKLPLRFRIKSWLWRHRPEIRTLRSENFNLTVKRWWKPSERKVARLSLQAMEYAAKEIKREVQKRFEREVFFGTGYEKKTWEK